jgi:hypothetical protein
MGGLGERPAGSRSFFGRIRHAVPGSTGAASTWPTMLGEGPHPIAHAIIISAQHGFLASGALCGHGMSAGMLMAGCAGVAPIGLATGASSRPSTAKSVRRRRRGVQRIVDSWHVFTQKRRQLSGSTDSLRGFLI